RRYRSQLNYDGPLGFGWDFNYNESLFIRPSGNVVRVDGGSHVDEWVLNADGTFTAPAGFFGTLIREPDGSYVLREPNGFKRLYRPDGRLYAHQDRHGNKMLFEYDGRGLLNRVIDSYGREIDFVFEQRIERTKTTYRLTRIRDFAGREILYSYDENGDL